MKQKDIVKDIVHAEAFKVIKNDLLQTLKEGMQKESLTAAFGAGTLEEFIEDGNYQRLGLVVHAAEASKTEQIYILLEASQSLHEFILLMYLAQDIKKGVIIIDKKRRTK